MDWTKRTMLAVLMIGFALGMIAQSVDAAGEKYNDGTEALKAKQYGTAIAAFEEALEMAEAAGPEAADLQGNIEEQLMNSYYKNGVVMYKQKNYTAAIDQLDRSITMANELGNSEISKKSTAIKGIVYSSEGMSLIQDNELDKAMASFNKALEARPNYVVALYGQGLVWKEKGNMEKMMASMDKAIEVGSGKSKMAKYVQRAKNAASKALVAEATEELTKEHGDIAAKYLNDSFKYKAGDADAYYYLTIAYNKEKQYSNATEAANKALGMKEGDKSDIYFELGTALAGKGDTSGACNAFKNVTGGPNVDAAKYQIEQVLNCG